MRIIGKTPKLKQTEHECLKCLFTALRYDRFMVKNGLVVPFLLSLYLLDPLPPLSLRVYRLFLLSFSFVLLLPLFQQGGWHTGEGGTKPARQNRQSERWRERESERVGASDFVTASKGKVFPRETENEGDGKRGRERDMEIKGKLHW